eukprot:gene14825-5942_t
MQQTKFGKTSEIAIAHVQGSWTYLQSMDQTLPKNTTSIRSALLMYKQWRRWENLRQSMAKSGFLSIDFLEFGQTCERHKPINRQQVISPEARKQLVSKKGLCLNCLGANHRASECKCQQGCSKCGARHRSSICNQSREPTDQTMLTSETRHVTYPVVLVKINGVKCRALLDTGEGSSYASATLIDHIGVPASRVEQRKIEMMMHTTMRRIQVCNLKSATVTKILNYALTSARWKRTFVCHWQIRIMRA